MSPLCIGPVVAVAWPSGPRRWFKAPVSSGAWVRIPPLPVFCASSTASDGRPDRAGRARSAESPRQRAFREARWPAGPSSSVGRRADRGFKRKPRAPKVLFSPYFLARRLTSVCLGSGRQADRRVSLGARRLYGATQGKRPTCGHRGAESERLRR
jgi:hypothetical protein